MKLYELIEFKSSNEINTIGIYTSELAIWLYLSYLGCQNDKRFKIIIFPKLKFFYTVY